MPIKGNSNTGRILELDVFRGLSAMSVLLFHYTAYFHNICGFTFPFYFPWLPYRIQMFAMISGFAILLVIEKNKNPMDFIVARFSRLYPCYFLTVILMSVLLPQYSLSFEKLTWPIFWGNLTMLQTWLGYPGIDGVFWFVAPELAFYVIVLLFLLFNKSKYIEGAGFAGLILVIINGRCGSFGPVGIPAVIVLSRILSFWQFFFAGILFYNLKNKGETWWRHAGLALCFMTQNIVSDSALTVICFAGCLLVFYLFIYGKLSWIAQKPLIFLGTISYSVYLIHVKVLSLVSIFFYRLCHNEWFRLITPTLMTILIATMMTYWIEKPVSKYIRSKYTDWRQRRRA